MSAPEWQGIDFWGDVAVFATRSGRRFYSTADSWHYAGNVVHFAEPPRH